MTTKIVSLPGRGSGNQYIDLFYDALASHDIDLVGQLEFNPAWFSSNLERFDAIHLHWPESIWRNYSNSSLRKLGRSRLPGTWRLSRLIETSFSSRFKEESLAWFKKSLILLRNHKKKIIWTWHNIEPHENVDDFDRRGQQLLATYADLIIFHSEYARTQCERSYDIQSETLVMPHGNYAGVYPAPRDRATILPELGLNPDLPIVGMLGNIREYKGVDIAIDACALLDGQVQFFCAGAPLPSFDWGAIEKKAASLKHCSLAPRFVSDQEFSDYAHVSDILLLPYRSVTGSGALLAALTLGKGVVASDLPFFRELLGDAPQAGMLSPPDNATELKRAIERYLEVDAATRSQAAFSLADKYSWGHIVPPVARAIKSHPAFREAEYG